VKNILSELKMVKCLSPLVGTDLFLLVSGNKNKMGFWHNYHSGGRECNNLEKENSRLSNVSDDFLFWFSGFTDAEGNF